MSTGDDLDAATCPVCSPSNGRMLCRRCRRSYLAIGETDMITVITWAAARTKRFERRRNNFAAAVALAALDRRLREGDNS